MVPRGLCALIVVLLAVTVDVYAQDPITVGFVQSSYTVEEGNNVLVCVEIKGSDDVGAAQVNIEMLVSSDPPAENGAMPDRDNAFGMALMIPGSDFHPPLSGSDVNIPTLNQSRRSACYDLPAYTDDRVEGTEVVKLVFVKESISANVQNDSTLYFTIVNILDPQIAGMCRTLQNPPNGNVSVGDLGTDALANYTCNVGYALEGSSTVSCQPSGQWSAPQPNCTVAFCPRLNRLDGGVNFGMFDYSGDLGPGELAMLICDEDYKPNSTDPLLCQDNFTWNASVPVCEQDIAFVTFAQAAYTVREEDPNVSLQIIRSGNLRLAFNISLMTMDNTATSMNDYGGDIMDVVFFSEETNVTVNIRIFDDMIIEDSENFTAELMIEDTFVEVGSVGKVYVTIVDNDSCGSLQNIPNGVVTIEGMKTGGVATYTCNEGYRLMGEAQRVCMANTEWNGTEPRCVDVMCPMLQDPPNGNVSVGDLGVDAYANYTCNKGYALEGSSTVSCQPSGQWSAPQPNCTVAFCPRLNRLDGGVNFGMFDYSGDLGPGELVMLICDEDYKPNSTDPLLCQDDFTWNASVPVCEQDIAFVTFAQAAYTVREEDPNVSLQIIRSGNLRLAFNISLMTMDNTATSMNDYGGDIMDVVFFSEETNVTVNIRIIDDMIIEDSENFTAELINENTFVGVGSVGKVYVTIVDNDSCGSLQNIPNGTVTIGGTRTGGVATYTCNEGYRLMGEAQRVCMANTEWNGTEPECVAVRCPDLSNPTNGVVTPMSGVYEETVTYTCNSGYGLVGPITRTCQSNGEWSGISPNCSAQCPPLSDPPNGDVDMMGNDVGSIAVFTCNTGYKLDGSSVLVCQSDKTWNSASPTCEIAEIRVGFKSGTTVDIVEGETLEICVIIISPPDIGSISVYLQVVLNRNPTNIPDGGAIATPDMDTFAGFFRMINGSDYPPRLPFQMDNNIFGRPLNQSTRERCFLQEAYSDNEVEGIEYASYRIATEPKTLPVVVLDNATSDLLIRIIDATATSGECEDLLDPENGEVVLSANTTGSTANYTCDDGYEVVGESVRTCERIGEWSGTAPICQLRTTTIGFIPSSYSSTEGSAEEVTLTIQRSRNIDLTATVAFSTVPGTADFSDFVSRDLVISFQTNETRKQVTIAILNDDIIEITEVFTATITAVEPNVVLGVSQATVSILDDDMCPDLEDDGSLKVTETGNLTGAVATYTCDEGYTLAGDNTRVCQNNSMWSGSAPSCEPVPCPELSNPENGAVMPTSGVYQQTATYSCNTGYTLNGVSTVTCQSNGTWSSTTPPDCDPVPCPNLDDPSNGTVSITTPTFGGTATFTCDTGFALVGTPTLTCDSDGMWSSAAPECKVFDPIFEETVYTVTENRAGEVMLCVTVSVPLPQDTAFAITSTTTDPISATVADFNPSTTITVTPPSTMACINFTDLVVDDDIALEGNQNFSISVGDSTAIVVIIDNDTPRITSTTTPVTEDELMAVVVVQLLNEIESNFILMYSTVSSGANEGTDFEGAAGRLVFTPTGVKSQEIDILIKDDQELEQNEPIIIQFSSPSIPSDESLNLPNSTVVIIDNEIGIRFAPQTYTVIESINFTVVSISRTGNVNLSAEVFLSTRPGTAGDEDYVEVFEVPVIFQPGEDEQGVIIDILDDDVFEETESFFVTLTTNQSNVILDDVTEAEVIIRDNDAGPRVNDTIIGDPLYTVHLPGIKETMCYEVRGESGLYLNLISDSCTSVNALYDSVPSNPELNRMSKIGIRAADGNGNCADIEVNVDNCSALVNGIVVGTMEEVGDIAVRQYGGNKWRVRVSNCNQLSAVMWITCSGEMLRFRIARGSSISSTSHGLLAQFWGIPVQVDRGEGNEFIQFYDPSHKDYRRFPYILRDITWDHSKSPCFYVGNKQGGPEKSHNPVESIIREEYAKYSTGSLFGTDFEFSQFDKDTCGIEDTTA